MRRFHRRLVYGAVRRGVGFEPPGMVNEPAGENQALLLIHQRKAPFAQPVVPAVISKLESRFAGNFAVNRKSRPRVRIRIVGRPHAVLAPAAILVEYGEELAVVQFQRAEVTVGERNHSRARSPRFRGNILEENRHRFHRRRVAEGSRAVAFPVHDRLHLGDFPVFNFQPQGEESLVPPLVNYAEVRGLAGFRIGSFQVVRPPGADRAP